VPEGAESQLEEYQQQQQAGAVQEDAKDGRCAPPVTKRVRFAEHYNHKFLFDAKAPCR
jgi:hypothetical protein